MDYVFTVRKVSRGSFVAEPGPARFLKVPPDATAPELSHQVRKSDWLREVLDASAGRMNIKTHQPMGDLVIYVHGYNHSPKTMLERLRHLRVGLEAQGFTGAVIGYDWPSADNALNYLEDRWDAKQTANQLVREGIESFVRLQRPDCEINLHIMAHSMGSYVVREAFDYADDRRSLASTSWSVSQVLLFGGDISASSLEDGNPKGSSLYRHCNRLTSYHNHYDNVLSLSNIKRVGVAPRAGRIGLPDNCPRKGVKVDCSARFAAVADSYRGDEFAGHRWYFTDETFLRDAYETLMGDKDRASVSTRELAPTGNMLTLRASPASRIDPT
ncbi:alpha/beta hydrolase [Meridianimarinicoccus aquatilis]|uniref:Alpha/beta hydrolase n=1 Tax=Meridianimarinicoccus aquatilis TaxID=2552766 RepID=A0A4R6ARI4_9RHOB|nr:alpha/beta hydrolase [Fluviibacterium aquatile]TDL87131.1 alpha/beta hydrolase [Fluviibacterium aquatile]